jgi:hypothetical protein
MFAAVLLLKSWDGRNPGDRLELVRWLAVSLVLRGIAWPLDSEEWR